jgi:hypothetical protein
MDVGTGAAATTKPEGTPKLHRRRTNRILRRREDDSGSSLAAPAVHLAPIEMIERLRTSLFALHALTPRELTEPEQEHLRGDCADALRLELDCPQQTLTSAQREPLARLRELLDETEVSSAELARAVHDAWSVVVRQPIVGYHLDDEGQWVAELACGHGQHVRHEPPWQVRPWVTTPEGRAKFLGFELECLKCERGEPVG